MKRYEANEAKTQKNGRALLVMESGQADAGGSPLVGVCGLSEVVQVGWTHEGWVVGERLGGLMRVGSLGGLHVGWVGSCGLGTLII